MHIVDSCGWLEWFTDGKLAGTYEQYLAEVDVILIPGVVLYVKYTRFLNVKSARKRRFWPPAT